MIVRVGAAFFVARTRPAGNVRFDFRSRSRQSCSALGRLLAGFFVHCESSSLASACSSPTGCTSPSLRSRTERASRLGFAHGVDVIDQPAQMAAAAEQPAWPATHKVLPCWRQPRCACRRE